jgi:hypothetical protein
MLVVGLTVSKVMPLAAGTDSPSISNAYLVSWLVGAETTR